MALSVKTIEAGQADLNEVYGVDGNVRIVPTMEQPDLIRFVNSKGESRDIFTTDLKRWTRDQWKTYFLVL